MTEPPPLSENHLHAWRALLKAHARSVSSIDHQLEKAQKIPLSWYDVLIELYEAKDRKLRLSELADRVLLSRSGLTRLIDRLEKEGYLKREKHETDRRGLYAVLTGEGRQVLREAWPVYRQGIQTHFAGHFSEEEARELGTLLDRLHKTSKD